MRRIGPALHLASEIAPLRALAPAALLGPSLAVAQALPIPPIAQLAPVVVTAARIPQPIATLTADLTVIDADAIAASGARSFAELLQGQPGVEIVQNGGPGATSGVFLRGANRGQTVLLVDGLRVSSSTVGAPTLEAIPLDQVERIEILRGPASSLYGADAIGGVIQVFTRRPGPGVSGRLSGGLGSDDTRTVAGGISATLGAVALSLQAGHRQSDGFNATTDPSSFIWNPDRDGYDSDDVGASAAVTFAPGHEASARYLRNRLDNQFDGGPGFDDRTRTTLELWQVESRNRFADAWTSQLRIGAQRVPHLSPPHGAAHGAVNEHDRDAPRPVGLHAVEFVGHCREITQKCFHPVVPEKGFMLQGIGSRRGCVGLKGHRCIVHGDRDSIRSRVKLKAGRCRSRTHVLQPSLQPQKRGDRHGLLFKQGGIDLLFKGYERQAHARRASGCG